MSYDEDIGCDPLTGQPRPAVEFLGCANRKALGIVSIPGTDRSHVFPAACQPLPAEFFSPLDLTLKMTATCRLNFSALICPALIYLTLISLAGCQDRDSENNAPEGNGQQTSSGNPNEFAVAPLLEDVTSSTGIDFRHQPVDHEQDYFMPRCVGSGGGFLDFDNDGRLDIYLLQNTGPDSGITNRIYRQTDAGFVDVSSGSGLDVDGFGMGLACGDVNNDGRIDVLLNEYGRARLFLNQTEGTQPRFTDVTAASGLENRMWGTSTCFFDFDRDGLLDLLLVNYVNYDPSRWCAEGGGQQEFCGPDAFPGRVTKLFHNDGMDEAGNPRFTDVTISAGLGEHPGPGLGVFCADFDGDRWPDIFIANDGKPNHLWINQQDGTFREEAITRGLGYNSMGKSEADMGIAIGDVNSDGQFDIFVTHLTSETHTLWSQGPRGIFIDRTATSGLTATDWRGTGFGTGMADLDNDGDLDLLIANGRVTRLQGAELAISDELPEFWRPYGERDQVMLNDGQGSFMDASESNPALSGVGNVSRGLACADFDNDGRLDVLITRIAEAPSLLRNVASQQNHWLIVRAIDPDLNRDAYGAEIYVQQGDNRLMRWINPGYSYLSSNDPRAHFGLGKASTIDHIEVFWPDGNAERFTVTEVDRQITLRKGEGSAIQ